MTNTTQSTSPSFSLRTNIPSLNKSSTSEPITPDFPFNTDPTEEYGGVRLKMDVIEKAGRGDEYVFAEPFSLRVSKLFHETNIHLQRTLIKFRTIALDEHFMPFQSWDFALNAPSHGHDLVEGNIVMMALFDQCSSVGRFFFFRVTSFGMILAGKHPVKFVDLERVLFIEDKPDATRIVQEEGIAISEEDMANAMSKCWAALTSFGQATPVTIKQHLYVTNAQTFDFEAYREKNADTIRFVEEEVSVPNILSYLNTIQVSRQKVLGNQGSRPLHLVVKALENNRGLVFVTMPTRGVRAPVAILTVHTTAEDIDLLRRIEPALNEIPVGHYVEVTAHYTNAKK